MLAESLFTRDNINAYIGYELIEKEDEAIAIERADVVPPSEEFWAEMMEKIEAGQGEVSSVDGRDSNRRQSDSSDHSSPADRTTVVRQTGTILESLPEPIQDTLSRPPEKAPEAGTGGLRPLKATEDSQPKTPPPLPESNPAVEFGGKEELGQEDSEIPKGSLPRPGSMAHQRMVLAPCLGLALHGG